MRNMLLLLAELAKFMTESYRTMRGTHPEHFEDVVECNPAEEVGLVWCPTLKKFFAYEPPCASPFWLEHVEEGGAWCRKMPLGSRK